jgi:plastocyanin domain-containing protein
MRHAKQMMGAIAAFLCLGGLGACSKGDKAAADPPLEIKGRRIDVLAKFDRYEPNEIPVKPGEQVTLVFKRVTTNDCLAELDIPSANVKKPLPVGQPVAIPYQAPDKPGDVEFVCGMNMVRGKFKVQ